MASIRPSLQIPFACLTTVCLLATTTPAPAHSTTILSADDSAALTRSAAASASVAPTTYREFFSDSSTTASTAQDTERTEVRASNSGNSITHFSNNESFSVSLPGSSSNVTRSSDSTVATLGDDARSDNFALAITTPAEGEATVHSILLTESAPQTFSYTFHNITRISSDGHGGADLFYADSNDELVQVGHVERAWARDAIGRPVPTHYEIHGSKLTQVVDHRSGGYTYPIVADPSWSEIWSAIKHGGSKVARDRKSTRLNSVTFTDLVCRLLLEKRSAARPKSWHASARNMACPRATVIPMPISPVSPTIRLSTSSMSSFF